MNIKEPLLSIIIVSWNSERQTLECVQSIHSINDYKSLEGKIEIIIIDNNSSDATVSILKEKFPELRIIQNKENIGYAPACNQGMRAAEGRYTLLLGSDTVLMDNSLTECIKYLETNNGCGAVGCRLLFPDGRLQGNCKKFPTLKNAFFTYLSLDKYNYDYDMLWFNYDKTIEVDQIATTFLMVRSNILKEINYFDESFRIMYNDVDLCKKIWDTGNTIVFLHTPVILHHGSLSTKKAGFKVRKIMYSDIFLYYHRIYGFKANFLLPVLFIRLMIVSIFK